MSKHISEEIETLLHGLGFLPVHNLAGNCRMTKLLPGQAIAGEQSDGSRFVTLEIDSAGRWLSSLDGFGMVEKDLDLRDFWGPGYCRPQAAIDTILKV